MKSRDAELTEKIMSLKARRKAVILAHNYQPGEVQDIADFVGDSLELSQKAAKNLESGKMSKLSHFKEREMRGMIQKIVMLTEMLR